jgi:multidrug efflux pump subunit AcrA (membrane-fusion protein)
MLVIVGGIGTGTYVYYDRSTESARRDQELSEAQAQLEKQQQEIAARDVELAERAETISNLESSNEKLEIEKKLLLVTERLYTLKDIQVLDTDDGVVSRFNLVERGHYQSSRAFEVQGEQAYCEFLVIKFKEEFTMLADEARRQGSICYLRRVFGNEEQPEEGTVVESTDKLPMPYRPGGRVTGFEQRLMQDFWLLHTDPERAEEHGIRAIHPEAPSMILKEGLEYDLILKASGGVEVKVRRAPPQPGETA